MIILMIMIIMIMTIIMIIIIFDPGCLPARAATSRVGRAARPRAVRSARAHNAIYYTNGLA